MPNALSIAYRQEMRLAHNARRAGDRALAFHHLERAHILGQRHLWRHAVTHGWMLWIGLRRGEAREVAGQIVRLVAVLPGYALGWVPLGNTGGADVSAIRPMTPPADLAVHFEGYSQARTIAGRALLLASAGAVWLLLR
jgi:hypothetical protein